MTDATPNPTTEADTLTIVPKWNILDLGVSLRKGEPVTLPVHKAREYLAKGYATEPEATDGN
ncbi:MAG: hypothetical protein AAGG38_07290 [Planctomycetota bacterium]